MGDWSILGNVNDGWFAQLSHAGEWVGRNTLNTVSFGGQWGDKMYGHMGNAASGYVANANQQAINNALSHGATQHQALTAGSDAMGKLVNPSNMGELGNLFGAGASVAGTTVKNTLVPTSMDLLGALSPLLIGAGVLGGIYLLADSFSTSSSKR